jgi:hypothetical protein
MSLTEGGRLTRESARKLRASARSSNPDPELAQALATLAHRKLTDAAAATHDGDDTFRRIYLRSQQPANYASVGGAAAPLRRASTGETWRAHATERGQTARIASRVAAILEEGGVNEALVNNKMFFGSNETGASEYLERFDGNVKMARAEFFASQQASSSSSSGTARRRTAQGHWTTVAGSTQKDAREGLMQRLRSSGGLVPLDSEQRRRRVSEHAARRQAARRQREEQRSQTVLGLLLNYDETRTADERGAEEMKLTRGMRTKRDALSGRGVAGSLEGPASQPVGQEEANRTLLWGPGNRKQKGFTTAETARRESEIVGLGGGGAAREYDRLRAGGRLTNAELGFSHKFPDNHDFRDPNVCTEAGLRRQNIALLAECDAQRPLKFEADQTRREWKGPVVWHPADQSDAARQRRGTQPGSGRSRWGLRKRLSGGHLVIVPPS